MVEINIPEAVAELITEFESYERAIVTGDFQTVIGHFWDSPHTLRYGTTVREHFYSNAEITAFRVQRGALKQPRTLRNTRITTYGRDYGTADTEYVLDGSDKIGRQSQTWVRFPEGWRIVSAHVSFGI
jgi:AtzH-like